MLANVFLRFAVSNDMSIIKSYISPPIVTDYCRPAMQCHCQEKVSATPGVYNEDFGGCFSVRK